MEEHGGTEYTVTGSYEGTETLDKKLRRIMEQNTADDKNGITEDAGEREGYGVAYLALCDAQNDDFYMGGFLRDSIVIEGNYLVFEDVEAGSQYYLSFDACFNDGYRLPYSPDMEKKSAWSSLWAYGYFEVSGTQATTVIRVPLHSETGGNG